MTTTDPMVEEHEMSEAEEYSHDASDAQYIQIAIILAVITAAEVATYFVDIGAWLWPSLMVMMVAKFALVVMYFMHLKFDNKLLSWTFVAGLVVAMAVYVVTLTTFEFFV